MKPKTKKPAKPAKIVIKKLSQKKLKQVSGGAEITLPHRWA